MVETDTIEQPQPEAPQAPPQGPGDEKLRALHDAVAKDYDIGSFDDFKKNLQDPAKRQSFYKTVGKDYDLGTYDEFQNKIGVASQSAAPTQTAHTPVADIRHFQDMANKPIPSASLGEIGDAGTSQPDPTAVAANKAYRDQFDKAVGETGQLWGAKPDTVKQVLNDFPDEPDENKLKGFAQLAETNPVQYGRIKDANTIRMAIAKDGPAGVHDANLFNHLQNADSYTDLTESVIPMQKQIMAQHNLGPEYMEMLKREKSPLINSLDPGLMSQYWNGPDKELGLTPDQYAGYQTELAFSPQKAQMDLDMIKHSRNLDESGQANPIDVSKEPYEYRRGLETVLMNLDMQGRNNKRLYIEEQKPQVDAQVSDLVKSYNDKLATASPAEATQLHQQFNAEPIVQEANKLEQGQDEISYSAAEDAMRYPLTHADEATRIVKDAMQGGTVGMADVRGLLQGAGESADNTMRWIKNTAINLAGSDGSKAFNNTSNIGHQALTELSGYEGGGYADVEQPLAAPKEMADAVQSILKDPAYHSDEEKMQHAITYVRNNFDQIKVNPKAGQQNITGKSLIYGASNMAGQILGVADQSFLMGGLIGDASKLQKMASAFTPMYMSTQNQMYEQALKNGDEHPLLKSNTDATIISLASLINPDIKVVRGMVGADSQLGKTLAGISDDTWSKVLSQNKPILDQAIGFAKGMGKQLGLANLQYGLIAPIATGLAHKALFNEDPNLVDKVTDAVIQTNISMALPALLHGVWGGKSAADVNPMQKYSLVEAGLHPDQNIDLIDSKIKSGQISEVAGHDMKQLIKHAGEFMLNSEMTKTDGSPMNEKEVSDNLYANLRLKVLQGKLKTAAEPIRPVIEERIHEVNQEISELHTSDADKHKNELNQMLLDNMDRIKDKMPTFEGPIKEAIKSNNPEEVFKMIADQAQETKMVDGKEISSRAPTEDIFGKELVSKAIELSKNWNNASRENIYDLSNTLKHEYQTGLLELQRAPDSEARAEILSSMPQRIYERMAQDPSIRGNPEAESKLQELFKRVGEKGDYSKTTLRGMSESELTDTSRRLYESIQSEMGLSGLPHENSSTSDSITKTNKNGKKTDNAQTEGRQELLEKPGGAENTVGVGAAPSIQEPVTVNTPDNAATTSRPESGQQETIENPVGQEKQEPANPEQARGQSDNNVPANGQAAAPDVNELPFGHLPVGVAHDLQVDRAKAELSVLPPERGEGITLQESIDRGKALLKDGADVGKMVADFQKDKKVSSDTMSVVRAAYNELAAKTNQAYDTYGEDSPQAKAAFTAERSFYNSAVKPMQTEWSKIGTAQQGVVDMDTGSVTSLKRAFAEQSGKEITEKQSAEAKEFASKVKVHEAEIEKLKKQLDEAIQGKKEKVGIKETGKALADKIRKAKIHRPDMFSAATPATLVWDSAVELTAKSVEAGASIADAIAKGIDHIKESDWYKGLKPAEQNKAEQQFSDWHNQQANEKVDLKSHFVNKTDSKFTPDEVKAIWDHTKKVMETKTDFHDVISQVGMDTGLTSEQVRRAISMPKGAKVITDKMYAEMYRRNQVVQAAQVWVRTADQSATKKFWNKVIRIPSAIVTFGHGSVAPITHVGADLYRPSNWKSYFNFMLDSYKFSFGGVTDAGKARYEKAMGDLVHDPMFIMAKRAGLKIDPTDLIGDDYSKYQSVFGRISKMGERGFNAMKPYRLEQFKKIYNGLSDQAKGNPDVVKAIAHMVNLSSGTTDAKIPDGADVVLFAPKLVTSQYQRIFTEPAKAVGTFANWSKSTDADKLQAKMVARHAGEMIATYMTLLASNQAILAMTGSKQKINFTNPLDSDWMKFKVGNKTVDASGGMNSALRFIGSLAEEGARANGIVKTPEKSKPGDVEGSKILQQLTNKLSPFAGDIKEGFSGTDMVGNPLPWSSVKPAAGKEKLGWSDYLETKLPIPIAEGFKTFNESAKDKGMPKGTLDDYLQAVLIGGLTGTTGAKVSPEPQPKEVKGGRPGRGSTRNK